MPEPTESVVVRRVMPAPPEVVYDEWLDAEALSEFLCPAPATNEVIACDPRVGGRLHFVMRDEDLAVNITGEYIELDRPNRIRFTWHSDMAGGFSSVVTVTFEAVGESETLMTIEHGPLPADVADDHEAGWTSIAEQLAPRLATLR